VSFGGSANGYTLGGLSGDKGLALTNMSGTTVDLTVGNNASDTTYGGALSAGGGLIKIGAGTLTLTGTNTYSGSTTISGGTLYVGDGGTTGTLGSGNVTNNAVLAFNRSDVITVNNRISGTGSLIKSGDGKLILNGTNTYSGLTTVSSGELIVNGSLQSKVTVSFGAFLAGSGTVGGDTLISGTHTLGNSPGLQTFEGNVTYTEGSDIIWELAKNTMMPEEPPVFDQMTINGDLRFTGLTKLVLACDVDNGMVDWSDSFWGSSRKWTVCDVAGSTYGFTNLVISLDDWTDNEGGLLSSERAGASFSLSQEGSDIVLNYVVPEPTVISLIGISCVITLTVRRFRAF
jgi:autotransporter-associated beta strand protein